MLFMCCKKASLSFEACVIYRELVNSEQKCRHPFGTKGDWAFGHVAVPCRLATFKSRAFLIKKIPYLYRNKPK